MRVTTANGAIPLEDAIVTVRDYLPEPDLLRGSIISVSKTNQSGLTDKISLPAPSRSNSLSPNNGKAYSSYNIQIDKDGYGRVVYVNVPVFEGITAVQSANMIPLPENGESDRENIYGDIFYESEGPRISGDNSINRKEM